MAINVHTVGTNQRNLKHYSCVSGQNHFTVSSRTQPRVYEISNVEFPTLRVPSDICSDVGLWPYLCEWTILTQCTSLNGG